MKRPIPTVWNVWGGGREWMELDSSPAGERVVLDSPAWFAWLAVESTQRFAYALFDARVGYIVGFVTVRKERRQRGGAYWVAYRRVAGQVRKVYIGHSSMVSAVRLAAAAERLAGKEVERSEQASR
jgi:hypothetical protein